MRPKRYVICGLSNRAIHEYALPLLGRADFIRAEDDFSGVGALVAILDIDETRTARFLARTGATVPFFRPDEFDRMVVEVAPDGVIVAGPDFTHARYAVAALDRGLDVIIEKPVAHSAADARAILDAERGSAGRVTVAHNARYEPAHPRLRQLVQSGAIGTVVSVDLVEGLDSYHGASYFRRWNRRRDASGGLAVTKGCHSLDLVSWILGDVPTSVYSLGGLDFYGPDSPHRPRTDAGELLSLRDEMNLNPYAQRWQEGRLGEDQELFTGEWQALGLAAQYGEGKPRSVFDDEIDVEDHYSAVIKYRGGASLSYVLSLSLPWEGYRLGITGTLGRIETASIAYRHLPEGIEPQRIRIDRLFGPSETVEVESEPGGHGGADARIRRDLFLAPAATSVLDGIRATSIQGAIAVATGEAMWRSVVEHREVGVADLLGLPQVPSWDSTVDTLPDGAH